MKSGELKLPTSKLKENKTEDNREEWKETETKEKNEKRQRPLEKCVIEQRKAKRREKRTQNVVVNYTQWKCANRTKFNRFRSLLLSSLSYISRMNNLYVWSVCRVQTAKQLLLIELFIVYSSSLSCSRLRLLFWSLLSLRDFNIGGSLIEPHSASAFH